MRILIIEDRCSFLNDIRTALLKKGFEVFCTSDGSEGLRVHRENPFNLAIVNINLPTCGGIDVLLGLKENEETRLISISHEAGTQQMPRRMGSDRSFTAPFNLEPVVRAVLILTDRREKIIYKY